ncbi:Conidiophore development regulator abaA [Dissostichus eleginoides]|uniref:Conidiophore development regulator abaA n=1 Tax=Dissostichus eleginoides TaxID=100907 RepID=A0AAD9FI38_DISEL|nr:Conidiophore development regulator abaA [Dissostichus eleginoides]
MSTLLPRKDLHPDTIHRINSNMSRDCILRPNVHLAHHPTLDINCLYDHVHLYKNTVPIFARTLKDVALNRDQSTPRRRSSPAQNPLTPERHPTGPPPRQHPWRQDHPHLLPHHAPLRSHQGSYDYPQARPEPLLSPGVPPQPQRRELHPDPLSYAQAVKRAAGPTLTTTTHVPEPTHTPPHDELRDIQQMLSLLCSHLIGQVPQ